MKKFCPKLLEIGGAYDILSNFELATVLLWP